MANLKISIVDGKPQFGLTHKADRATVSKASGIVAELEAALQIKPNLSRTLALIASEPMWNGEHYDDAKAEAQP